MKSLKNAVVLEADIQKEKSYNKLDTNNCTNKPRALYTFQHKPLALISSTRAILEAFKITYRSVYIAHTQASSYYLKTYQQGQAACAEWHLARRSARPRLKQQAIKRRKMFRVYSLGVFSLSTQTTAICEHITCEHITHTPKR